MAIQENRDLSFDAFKGLAIIAVIAIHAAEFGLRKQPSTGEWNFSLVAYQQLLFFAVPAFVFVAGYWMSQKTIVSLKEYKFFLARRLSRILIPYLLWSFVCIVFTAIRTHHVDMGEIAITLLTGKTPRSHYYWFFIMLSQMYILTPLLQQLNNRQYGLILAITLNVLAILFRYVSKLYLNDTSIAFYLSFCSWVMFFQIGLLVGSGGNGILGSARMHLFILPAILVSLLISQAEAIVILSKYGDPAIAIALSPLKYSSLLYAVCVIFGFLFVRERFKNWPKLLVISGQYSLGIYLIHMFVLVLVVRFCDRFSVIPLYQPVHQLVLVAATLSICLVFISAARKVLPKLIYSRILGF
jgi:probable poly-beta-1,6-N-acetyl-D-glucosamine export protein